MLNHYYTVVAWKWTFTIICALLEKGIYIVVFPITLYSFLSNKNTVVITESISVQGKPHNVGLDDKEITLLLALNITVDGPVLLYPQLLLRKTNRVVGKDSGKTLRDNSCITYRINDSVHVGTLHKVILYAGDCFIFINDLPLSEEKLCNEHISYLHIDEHIYKICSFRYSIMSLTSIMFQSIFCL